MQTRETIACESATLLSGIATEGAAPLDTGNVVTDDKPGIVIEDCTIIEGDRWGSSGYYKGEALERSVPKNIFHENLQVFLDHADPDHDSAGNLMGHLAGDARFVREDGVPKLKGPIRFYQTGIYNADYVRERLNHLGLSIRAGVLFENGTVDGRAGKIITDFTKAISVDVVARAGAGGKFGSIKESESTSAITHEEEGADVPITKEDAAAIGAAVAEALKPEFTALSTAVAEAAKPTFKEYTPGALAKELATEKLSEEGQAEVWSVFEAKGDVEAAIAKESAREKKIREAATGRPEGGVINEGDKLDEHGKPIVKEASVTSWGSNKKDGE